MTIDETSKEQLKNLVMEIVKCNDNDEDGVIINKPNGKKEEEDDDNKINIDVNGGHKKPIVDSVITTINKSQVEVAETTTTL